MNKYISDIGIFASASILLLKWLFTDSGEYKCSEQEIEESEHGM